MELFFHLKTVLQISENIYIVFHCYWEFIEKLATLFDRKIKSISQFCIPTDHVQNMYGCHLVHFQSQSTKWLCLILQISTDGYANVISFIFRVKDSRSNRFFFIFLYKFLSDNIWPYKNMSKRSLKPFSNQTEFHTKFFILVIE